MLWPRLIGNMVDLGGWASIYIEMSLRAIVLQPSVLVLIAMKLVIQLRAIELLALMFTGNTNICCYELRIISTYACLGN